MHMYSIHCRQERMSDASWDGCVHSIFQCLSTAASFILQIPLKVCVLPPSELCLSHVPDSEALNIHQSGPDQAHSPSLNHKNLFECIMGSCIYRSQAFRPKVALSTCLKPATGDKCSLHASFPLFL